MKLYVAFVILLIAHCWASPRKSVSLPVICNTFTSISIFFIAINHHRRTVWQQRYHLYNILFLSKVTRFMLCRSYCRWWTCKTWSIPLASCNQLKFSVWFGILWRFFDQQRMDFNCWTLRRTVKTKKHILHLSAYLKRNFLGLHRSISN